MDFKTFHSQMLAMCGLLQERVVENPNKTHALRSTDFPELWASPLLTAWNTQDRLIAATLCYLPEDELPPEGCFGREYQNGALYFRIDDYLAKRHRLGPWVMIPIVSTYHPAFDHMSKRIYAVLQSYRQPNPLNCGAWARAFRTPTVSMQLCVDRSFQVAPPVCNQLLQYLKSVREFGGHFAFNQDGYISWEYRPSICPVINAEALLARAGWILTDVGIAIIETDSRSEQKRILKQTLNLLKRYKELGFS